MSKQINNTPTYKAIFSVFMNNLENGNEEQKENAREYFQDLAEQLDKQ